MSLLRIENLTYRHPNGSLCLSEIELSVEEGEFVVIVGRNGSGKTTLCRHFNGLLLPERGSVLIDGFPVGKDLKRARRIVGMVFQNSDSQIVGETVYADIAFGPENLRLSREEIDRRVERAMRIVGLEDLKDHRPHTLSGGEKRRLTIAGVLAMESRIVVLDEPFSNLDYPGSKQVLGQILRLRQDGRAVVVVGHELEITAAHADRIVLMEGGRIVKVGKPERVVRQVEQFGVREPCSFKYGKGIASWLN